ncbi:nitrite reductase small subunit NirD [Streptomyces sp. ST2-7A]|uniref:nitrite reductase small subunit NirD n=1 Tax=Streptomyces sp. ST2-7A TaxID=2907214 RepID=UPI001F2B3092|nr:nitrite reductase small subunit NirD [Streptomyces sp. ST2-7A]MCE7079136.1 nitrite reductase small subunit NirD [Streptomyces sp. ST2-7A]
MGVVQVLSAPPAGTERAVAGTDGGEWVTVCAAERLTPGRGVAALLPDGRQAAVFPTRAGRVHAIDNRDPFTGAMVLSRGLLGTTADGTPFVASPLLKQRFALTDGRCLDEPDNPDRAVTVLACRVVPAAGSGPEGRTSPGDPTD